MQPAERLHGQEIGIVANRECRSIGIWEAPQGGSVHGGQFCPPSTAHFSAVITMKKLAPPYLSGHVASLRSFTMPSTAKPWRSTSRRTLRRPQHLLTRGPPRRTRGRAAVTSNGSKP